MRKGISVWDIAAMAAHLPADSAVMRALRPPRPDDVWTLIAQLLAEATDRLGRIEAIQLATATGKKRIEMPEQIERPGVVGSDSRLDADRFESAQAFADWYAAQPGGRRI